MQRAPYPSRRIAWNLRVTASEGTAVQRLANCFAGRLQQSSIVSSLLLAQEFDSVEVNHFSPDDCRCSKRFLLRRRPKHNFDLGSRWKIGGGEQVHPVFAQVQSRALDERLAHVYVNGKGDPLPLGPPLISNGSEEHVSKLTACCFAAKMTDGHGRRTR